MRTLGSVLGNIKMGKLLFEYFQAAGPISNLNQYELKIMEDNTNFIESLLERVTDYGQTSMELAKLKALDKTSQVMSSFFSNATVLIIISLFALFLNFGLAIWIGQILGEIYLGFFAVAGFYGITAVLIYFFMQKWIKRTVGNTFIKQVLK